MPIVGTTTLFKLSSWISNGGPLSMERGEKVRFLHLAYLSISVEIDEELSP